MNLLARRQVTTIVASTGIALCLLALASALLIALDRGGAQAAPSVIDVGSPTGGVMPFSGTTPLPGWLIADGSEVSRTQYADLFAVIGITYGAGNGTTTFNLPDLRGRVVAGLGTNPEVDSLTDSDGLPVDSRKVKHKHTLGTLSASGGSHTHTINDPGHVHSINDPGHVHNKPSDVSDFLATSGSAPNRANIGGGSSAETFTATAPAFTGITINRATTGITINPASITLPNSAFSGFVGDTSGPTDGPAYQVLYYIVKD
jgi:microcystin-dependent protein